MVPGGGITAAREPLAPRSLTEHTMAQNHNEQTDIQPLDDEALEEAAGGSSSACCSCCCCSLKNEN